jgi:outer membrane protein assembly factor BamA
MLLTAACSNTKKLPQGDSLYTGSSVSINDREASRKERKIIRNDLNAAVRPKPNTKTLGMRLKLRIYNFAGEPKKQKGFKYWLRNKVGEPPVLTSTVNIETNQKLLSNMLANRGFFFNTVQGQLNVKGRKSTLRMDVTTGPQYFINKTSFENDSTQISAYIIADSSNTLLRKGAPYNLELIKGERKRIDKLLKEKGFYYFNPDYLYAQADTTVGDHKVNLIVRMKKDTVPEVAYNVYKINDVYVYPNYRLGRKASDTDRNNAVQYKSYRIIDPRKTFKPSLFWDMLVFDSGEVYNRTDQNTSVSRLVNLGTFKFVKNRFQPLGDSLLDVYYYLSPFPKKSLRFEIGALTQNDSRAGSQVNFSWRNRNAFKRAEELIVKLSGGFEAQYSGVGKRPNIYNVGAEVSFTFPYFVVPFFNIESWSSIVPRSLVKVGYTYEAQTDLLRINSYKASYGYVWKEDVRKEHQFFPINFNYVKTDTLSTENTNTYYGNLIFDGIIIGPTYEFTYNSQLGGSRRNNFYFDGLVDFSGNIIGLAQGANYKDNPQELLGQNYAQYMKYQVDFRYYLRSFNANTWANRILIGYGVPYGNSSQLPNIKQFFSGGNSSLRGFRSRLVGPGTFNEQYLMGTNNYIQTLGDIKLEINTEYRFDIYKFFKGAIFADAGNVWLANDNANFPGGKFTSQFYRELAVDGGIGLRFDFKILLLRLDLGIPLREPWLPEGNRWVINEINFGDPEWRSQNMIFNISIGYPF